MYGRPPKEAPWDAGTPIFLRVEGHRSLLNPIRQELAYKRTPVQQIDQSGPGQNRFHIQGFGSALYLLGFLSLSLAYPHQASIPPSIIRAFTPSSRKTSRVDWLT